MSISDSDTSSDRDYYSDDSIGIIPPEDGGMEGNMRAMAIDIAINAVLSLLLEDPGMPEMRLRARITYRLKVGERACKLARGSIHRWTMEDIHNLAMSNLPPVPDDPEEDPEENVEFEEEDLDADLIPGYGLVDEPIDWEGDFDGDLDDAIIDNFDADHQTWTFPLYDWPSDVEE